MGVPWIVIIHDSRLFPFPHQLADKTRWIPVWLFYLLNRNDINWYAEYQTILPPVLRPLLTITSCGRRRRGPRERKFCIERESTENPLHQLNPDCGHPAIQSDLSADRERTWRVHSVSSSAILVVVTGKFRCPYGDFYVAYCVLIAMESYWRMVVGWSGHCNWFLMKCCFEWVLPVKYHPKVKWIKSMD